MFTGIVREQGEVLAIERTDAGVRLRIAAALAGELGQGDSVAVNGACLTATERANGSFEADVINQTLSLTNLGELEAGARVNLEPALRAGDPLGGHIVQGHIDSTGEVTQISEDGNARRARVALPHKLARYAIERGSVALDGVSLTIAALEGTAIEVSLIPETLATTTLGDWSPGRHVNVELDLIARYVERLVQTSRTPD